MCINIEQGILYYMPANGDWFRSIGDRFSLTEIWYLAHNVHKLGIQIVWNRFNFTISFELRESVIRNRYPKTGKSLEYIISGLVID